VPTTATDRRSLIVTGASSGIGRALALAAARDGYGVTAVARRADRLESLASEIRANGGACATLAIDVRAADAPSRIVTAAMQAFGRIDVLVNNAGGGAFGRLLEQTDAQIDAQVQAHVLAPLRLARAALPELRRSHGVLVLVGSGIARVPVPNYGAYALAKGAIRAAATQLRRELKADGVAVTYLDPGLVATEFHEAMGVERAREIPAAPPERVARNLLRAIRHRAATAHGTPWQTFGTMIGEWAGPLADPAIAGMAPKRSTLPAELPQPEAAPQAAPPKAPSGGLDAALEPVARRMERVRLPADFVRGILAPGAELELNEVAMRWAGMPNKNERAALREVLDALAGAGYVEPIGEESWKVVRAAD